MYNLTDNQKTITKWLVQSVKEGKLNEEFEILWVSSFDGSPEAVLANYNKSQGRPPKITQGTLDALIANELIRGEVESGSQSKTRRRYNLTGRAYEAVDTDFNASDTSFIKYLTPLAAVSDFDDFDDQLRQRCLRILGAGAADSTLWDSSVRTAGVILEERLRDIGSISDPNRTGKHLVNDVFGTNGTLASKFTVASEREGYRDLYAGIVGAYRNPFAHRLIDPSPEEGGAFIVFVNLLLKKLEALR